MLATANEVRACLDAAGDTRGLPERLEHLSALFLGRPYVASPLVGSRREPEQVVTRLDGFDCVTYAESVLALAFARDPEGYELALTALRYLGGRPSWQRRNHYMHQWVRRNVRSGLVRRLLPHRWRSRGPERILTALEGYPPPRWKPRYLPAEDVDALVRTVLSGDMVFFVSDRPDLDTFHVGLLAPRDGLAVRHASRSRGEVVEEPLARFLGRHRVPGMLVARPCEPAGQPQPDPCPGGRS